MFFALMIGVGLMTHRPARFEKRSKPVRRDVRLISVVVTWRRSASPHCCSLTARIGYSVLLLLALHAAGDRRWRCQFVVYALACGCWAAWRRRVSSAASRARC
jgi:hypothetical protein